MNLRVRTRTATNSTYRLRVSILARRPNREAVLCGNTDSLILRAVTQYNMHDALVDDEEVRDPSREAQ